MVVLPYLYTYLNKMPLNIHIFEFIELLMLGIQYTLAEEWKMNKVNVIDVLCEWYEHANDEADVRWLGALLLHN